MNLKLEKSWFLGWNRVDEGPRLPHVAYSGHYYAKEVKKVLVGTTGALKLLEFLLRLMGCFMISKDSLVFP